ncbi:MAG: hypothetical protein M3P43_14035 [Actinomycetota bacterium]|nr:hypothetical protein [Actinomycetota bacterium]
MWVFPVVAAIVAFVFAAMLGKQFAIRRGQAQLLWAIALAMYGVASIAVTAGVLSGWTRTWFILYWAFGAVLNVAFLAGGELVLLFRRRWVLWAVWLVLVFVTAYTFTVLRGASVNPAAFADRLPLGRDVFGSGTPAHRLAQLVAYPAYVILLLGTLWSAWKMRGRPELTDRFVGTLLIAVGATIVAGGAAFAAAGVLPGLILTIVAGICVMFAGFVRASRRAPLPQPIQTS